MQSLLSAISQAPAQLAKGREGLSSYRSLLLQTYSEAVADMSVDVNCGENGRIFEAALVLLLKTSRDWAEAEASWKIALAHWRGSVASVPIAVVTGCILLFASLRRIDEAQRIFEQWMFFADEATLAAVAADQARYAQYLRLVKVYLMHVLLPVGDTKTCDWTAAREFVQLNGLLQNRDKEELMGFIADEKEKFTRPKLVPQPVEEDGEDEIRTAIDDTQKLSRDNAAHRKLLQPAQPVARSTSRQASTASTIQTSTKHSVSDSADIKSKTLSSETVPKPEMTTPSLSSSNVTSIAEVQNSSCKKKPLSKRPLPPAWKKMLLFMKQNKALLASFLTILTIILAVAYRKGPAGKRVAEIISRFGRTLGSVASI
ncbi:hypothetical protein BC830DRAFT_1088361 [Chytriomyces sp. MP71]|nr:hypothetical protein BC830DRAFT_1088361 [Chytriomyces sp. MP71]